MRLGLQINKFEQPGGDAAIAPALAAKVKAAEAAGFATAFVMDHMFQLPTLGPIDEAMLECYTALAFMAAHTSTIKLGTMVTGITYRIPGVLLKTVTTVDVLSGGRTYFGIGAAWFEREHLALGIPFPPVKERFVALEETLQLAHQMWRGETGPYKGQQLDLSETICRPLPVSQPHPPILIGGGGETKTLKYVAQYGDACNLGASDLPVLEHKLNVLKRHCEEQGRDYSTIYRTSLGGFKPLSRDGREGTMTMSQAEELIGTLAGLGIDEALMGIIAYRDEESIELVNDLITRAGKLAVAGR